MAQSRRDTVQNEGIHPTTHAGLWLDKYLDRSIETKEVKPGSELAKEIHKNIQEPTFYNDLYHRWEETLKTAGARYRNAEVQTRLAINLGAESVLETSIALHRTYGTSYIPGSALKGLAAAFAHQYLEDDNWRKGNPAHTELFGTTEQSGCVTFYDALYVPDSGYKSKAIWPDIITTHHPDYYSEQDKPPADWDNPTLIPFLTATGKYLIALSGDDAWVDAAFQILENALAQEGIGAKISSGYGRMELQPELGDEVECKGVIADFDAYKGYGKIRDIETGQEYSYNRSQLPQGKDMPKGGKVYFTIYTGVSRIIRIRERFV